MAIVQAGSPRPDVKQVVTLAMTTAADGRADILDTRGLALAAVSLSTVWTSAVMSFRCGNSTATMAPLFSSTLGEYTITCTSSQMYYVNPDIFRGFRYIQPVSGNSTTIVAQTTATSIYAHVASLDPKP